MSLFHSEKRLFQLTPTSRDESLQHGAGGVQSTAADVAQCPGLVSSGSQRRCAGERDGGELFITSGRKLAYNQSRLFPLSSMAHACTGSAAGKALAPGPGPRPPAQPPGIYSGLLVFVNPCRSEAEEWQERRVCF